MFKCFNISIILIVFMTPLFSQHDDDTLVMPMKRESFSVTMGTGYAGSSMYSVGSSYINPRYRYIVNPRLKVHAGGVLSHYNFSGNMFATNNIAPQSNSSLVYFGGDYRINSKLTISATGYTSINNAQQQVDKNVQNFYDNMNMQGMYLQMDYKINDNMFFRGIINLNNGNSPYAYYNPFYRNSFYHNDPFHSSFSNSFMDW